MAVKDSSELLPVYLIWGSESVLLDKAVNRLKKLVAEKGDLDFNLEMFDGEGASVDEIIAAANTLPFMSDRRLVIVKNAHKMNAAALGTLADYASDPNPSATLVLVAEKIAKNLRIYKAVDALGGAAEYSAPKKSDYGREVVKMFAERGKTVGIDAAEVLVRAVGHDLRRLAGEVDKVVAYKAGETHLSMHDVAEVMSTTGPTSVFELLDALGAREGREVLRSLAELVADGESVHGIFSMSVRHVRSLLSTRSLLDREGRVSQERIAREVGTQPWIAGKLMRQAARFTERDLVAALTSAAVTEREMKTSRDARLALERWYLAVCRQV